MFLKNRNISSKIKRSKVTYYAALKEKRSNFSKKAFWYIFGWNLNFTNVLWFCLWVKHNHLTFLASHTVINTKMCAGTNVYWIISGEKGVITDLNLKFCTMRSQIAKYTNQSQKKANCFQVHPSYHANIYVVNVRHTVATHHSTAILRLRI